MSRKIELTKGRVAIVSDVDYSAMLEHRWHCTQNFRRFKGKAYKEKWYARRRAKPTQGEEGGHKYMHRIVMERKLGKPLPPGMHVDHIDGDGLNNQRDNLRLVTPQENLKMNQFKPMEEPSL